jgi:maltooligosyltrehalose trehalohydrolase
MAWSRRYPAGAELRPEGGVDFRVWAPRRRRVAVVLEGESRDFELRPEGDGYHGGVVEIARAGSRYLLRLDDNDGPFPDPASRFQPEGPHGPSVVVDPHAYPWQHPSPAPLTARQRVVYELHVGTFTQAGTWQAAITQLPELAALGINTVELMPVGEFAGRFGWGYDGVDLFAPSRLYGTPDDMRRFVDVAHANGIAVMLDVVYNHFGPSGCYVREFSDRWFSTRYENEWGDPLNFDGDDAQPVRDFVTANAACWIEEFRLDGLRIDATQQMFDASPRHILTDIVASARRAAGARTLYIVCENEPQDRRLLAPVAEGGSGADALWNDDFHHSAVVALTGHNEAYYSDYAGTPQELVACARRGFLYQGQRSRWQKKRRGTPTHGLTPAAFVHYLENHDQVANSASGQRLWQRSSPGRYRALTALLLLGAQTPMLFQGQEFASSRPFLYFADHDPELARAVKRGRAQFLSQFPTVATSRVLESLPDPADPATFLRSKLDFSERDAHAPCYDLHRDLMRLRAIDVVLGQDRAEGPEGSVLGDDAFVLRFACGEAEDRLLIVNLGRDLALEILPEPLLAPPDGKAWRTLWSSEDPRYGGAGALDPERDEGWLLPGEAAVLLGTCDAQ